MPKGDVILIIEDRLLEKDGGKDKRVVWLGTQKKIKSSTHLIVGWMSWYFNIATVVSAMLPCILLAMARTSIATF